MDNSKTEKQLHRELKYEGKKVRQREKKKEDGIFKKQRLFDEPNKPAFSRQLPNEPWMNRVEKRILQKSTESQTSGSGRKENSCNESQGI